MEKTDKKLLKPEFKELKKLVEICRKAGIKEFKGMGYELTLTDSVPKSNYKRKQNSSDADPVADLQYTDEEMLLWSSSGIPAEAMP